EMAVAQRARFPMERVHFHGNNKLPEELAMAVDLGVGRIVIDNFTDIGLLDEIARARRAVAEVLVRVAPGIEAHTHEYLRTGSTYSKFGLPIVTGQAKQAVERVMAAKHLNLAGFHGHVGSQIFDLLPFEENVAALLDFGAQMQEQCGFDLLEISPGGGLGIEYTEADDPPSIDDVAATITGVARNMAAKRRIDLPTLILEPGRSLVGQAGMTLYTAGSIKEIPNVRKYVAVDGGMADNIRPALYQARYTAIVANKASQAPSELVTLAGKYCESGDILITDVHLPPIESGDVIAVPATGAYCASMASNYNLALKPAIVAVKDGQARLIRRRESYEDLMACEVLDATQ
ncbi:MAG: diaminopimelate decarboxylase, partial [Chloroflexota bacterium]|nr:diaminopimelate decarboxylase [Chloroflexota bacterium]